MRLIYARYIALGSGRAVADGLTSEGYVTQAGGRISSAFVLRHVESRLYRGELRHRGAPVPGIHEPIVSEETWLRAQAALASRKRPRPGRARGRGAAMLDGRIFDDEGHPMNLTFTYGAGEKVYRYYASTRRRDGSAPARPVVRLRAADLEEVVARLVCNLVEAGGIAGVRRIKAGPPSERPSSRPSRDLADHRSMVRQVVDRVDVRRDGVTVALKSGEGYAVPLPLVPVDLPRLTPAHGSGDPG